VAHEFVSQASDTGTYGVAPAELERETHDNLLDCHLRTQDECYEHARREASTIRSFFSLAVNFGFPFFFETAFGTDFVFAEVDVRAVVKVVSKSAVSL
jgi:hypothetical protein